MKTWAVIYPYQEGQTEGKVVATYKSEEPNYSRFGGAWGSKKKSLHLEVPEALANQDISKLEAKMIQDMVACIGSPVVVANSKQMKKAYDVDGNPILDESGKHLEVPEYEYEHIFEPVFKVCLKD